MKNIYYIEDFIKLVGGALKCQPEKTDGFYKFPVKNLDVSFFEVSEKKLQEIFAELNSLDEIDDSSLGDNHSYETLVSDKSTFMRFRSISYSGISKYDEENKISYALKRPSDCFLVYLINKLQKVGETREFLEPIHLRNRPRKEFEDGTIEVEPLDNNLFNALQLMSPSFVTIQLLSKRSLKNEEFLEFVNAFLYYISYNYGIPIVPQKHLQDLKHGGRIAQYRPIQIDEPKILKKIYISELVYHYQLAVASDNPSLEYLSYYHILEYFFDDIFYKEVIQPILIELQQTIISPKNKASGLNVINELRNPKTFFKEEIALQLLLKKYVNISELKSRLTKLGDDSINYYKNTPVVFSNGDTFDLTINDHEKTIIKIANRIYKTRNSLVHSKENKKSRFIPFNHDKELLKEISFLRIISELIISESASDISLSAIL